MSFGEFAILAQVDGAAPPSDALEASIILLYQTCVEPVKGLAPSTCGLQNRYSANLSYAG